LGDSNYTGAFPEIFDQPAQFREHGPVDGENINRWNLDRHNLSVNFVFLDWSVRKVGLKQLWQLKYSKQTVESGGQQVTWGHPDVVPQPDVLEDWPEWMQPSKNYEL
jgi:prepilin-type processing-associated H-X9-DG protein